MIRILVISDSHGQNENVEAAVEQATKKAGHIDYCFHCGDIECPRSEIEVITRVGTYVVRGNCDYDSKLLQQNVIDVGNHRIYMTHGHRHNVHYEMMPLYYSACENDCDIALFGHTHVPFVDQDSEVTIVNPGSVSRPRQEGKKKTYAILTITDEDDVEVEICEME